METAPEISLLPEWTPQPPMIVQTSNIEPLKKKKWKQEVKDEQVRVTSDIMESFRTANLRDQNTYLFAYYAQKRFLRQIT